MSKTLLKSLLGLCILTGSHLSCAAPKNHDATINIGIYAPFSDQQAFIGRHILGAMEMASEEHPTSKRHYSFFTLDEDNETQNPALTIDKFIKANHLKVLITQNSTNGVIAAPVAKENNIIHFSMASYSQIADGKNNFLAWSPANEQAQVLVRQLQQQGVNRLGIISSNGLSDTVLTDAVLDKLKNTSSIHVILNEKFQSHLKDFSTLVRRMKGYNADLYLIMGTPKQVKTIQLSMKEQQLNTPVTTIVERVTPQIMTALNGQWYVDTQEMKPEFIRQFKEDNMNYPATEAGYAYDVFQMLDKSLAVVMKKRESISTQNIAKELHAVALGEGVMGPYSLDNKGILLTKSEIKTIKEGQVLVA